MRRYGYKGTWCVVIATNSAGGAIDIYEILFHSLFDLGLWIKQNNISRQQTVYGQSLTGALKLGKECLGISVWNVTSAKPPFPAMLCQCLGML
jgi:hypothetical protein